MRSEIRSHNGCWTCRARRKKCDETSPGPCKTCESLQLTCHGYGPRPSWMDGGGRERAKVAEFKAAVKHNSKIRRRAKSMSHVSIPSVSGFDARDACLQNSQFYGLPDPRRTAAQIEQATHVEHLPLTPKSTPTTTTTYIGDFINEDNIHNVLGLEDQNENEFDQFLSFLGVQEPNLEQSCIAHSHVTATDDRSIVMNIPSPQTQGPSIAGGSNENVVSYYVDTIFWHRFPCLSLKTIKNVRQGLRDLSNRSDPCLSAIMSHTIYRRQHELAQLRLNPQPGYQQAVADHEAAARRGLRLLVQDLKNHPTGNTEQHQIRVAEAQVCTVLMCLFLIERQDSSWPEILHLASAIPVIEYNQFTERNFDFLNCFQNALLYIDTIGCTWSQRMPRLSLDSSNSYASDFGSSSVFGCSRAVMKCIRSISELRSWKTEQSFNGSLSLLSLAKRAMQLDTELQQVRAGLPASTDDSDTRISTVFASAASIYLHCTISGPHPEIPEIKQGVADTVDGIKSLNSVEVLKCLSWPICIAACLADSDSHDFFDQLRISVAARFGTENDMSRALNTAKQCWRLRRFGGSAKKGYDWVDAMNTLTDIVPIL